MQPWRLILKARQPMAIVYLFSPMARRLESLSPDVSQRRRTLEADTAVTEEQLRGRPPKKALRAKCSSGQQRWNWRSCKHSKSIHSSLQPPLIAPSRFSTHTSLNRNKKGALEVKRRLE